MRYELSRDFAKNFALMLTRNCPPSRELSLALTKVDEAVFWANASIARNEKRPETFTVEEFVDAVVEPK